MEKQKNKTTKTQQEMVGRLVLKLAQIKLPMDLLHIEERIDDLLAKEEAEGYGDFISQGAN